MLSMLKRDFWYDLPKELIAQEPACPRDAARLMVLNQKDDSIQHRIFRDLPEYLEPGDNSWGAKPHADACFAVEKGTSFRFTIQK